MRVAIIGSGLGGLLTAALLSEKGHKVDVFEKLKFYGGRFTNLKYRGFQISTGALHMIPHGKRGPLGILLRKAGSRIEIIDSDPEGEALYRPLFGNERTERITVRSSVFPLGSKLKFFKWLLKFRVLKIDPYMDRYEKELDDFSEKFLRSFLGWSLSIQPSEIKYSKLLAIYRNVVKFGGPGIPVGGCKAVVDSLAEIIRSNNGEIHLRNPVLRLYSKNKGRGKKVTGVKNKNGKIEYDMYISNVGHQVTGKLLGKEYVREVESRGIKYSISLEKPFVGHTGVLFTLNCRRISGVNEVTNADPELAPSGKQLLMAHQPMITSNVQEEIRLGLEDLRILLKGYEYEVLAIQSYFDGWPVNRVRSGLDAGYQTPYSNLFVVGDGAKGDDIEVDGIALGITELLSREFGEKINLG